jgi:DNA repair protein RecO (recombination protein O)
MQYKTKGIIFHSVDYRETSLVVKIYTEAFGIQSYIVNSVRKKNARIHTNLFQPLTPVDLVVYHKDKPGLRRISEIRPSPPLSSIPFDIIKGSLILFLNEVLYKSIKEEESNPPMFDFIYHSIIGLDEHSVPFDFHLLFLLRLSKFLGFYPTNNYSAERKYFNFPDGTFHDVIPNHPHYLDENESKNFIKLIHASGNLFADLNLNSEDRRKLIEALLAYYRLHIAGFDEVHSHKVLEQVFH